MMPVLNELTDRSHERSGACRKERYKHVGVVFLASASKVFFFAERVYGGGNPGVRTSLGEECSCNFSGAEGEVETDKNIVEAALLP